MDFFVHARINTDVEAEYIMNGGILPYVLRKLLVSSKGFKVPGEQLPDAHQ